MTHRRLFTLEEANQLIPELENRLAQIFSKKENYAQKHDKVFMHELLCEAEGDVKPSPSESVESDIKQMEDAVTGLEEDLQGIRALGCYLRNLDRGFIDFLARKDGELVFFCWKKGENTIQYYHSQQHGFSQRIPLES